MTYRVWGDRFESGELSSTARSQIIQPQSSLWLGYVRTQVIFYNDPAITNLTCKIYSDEVGSPSTLLYESTTTLTKAEMITEENGVKEIAFAFNGESMAAGVNYHIVLSGAGYSPSSSSYMAWMKSFPEPVNAVTGASLEIVKAGVWPYALHLIGTRS